MQISAGSPSVTPAAQLLCVHGSQPATGVASAALAAPQVPSDGLGPTEAAAAADGTAAAGAICCAAQPAASGNGVAERLGTSFDAVRQVRLMLHMLGWW